MCLPRNKSIVAQQIKGRHEAIVSEELLERCLEARERVAGRVGNGRPAKPYRVYLLGKAIYWYHCGEPLRCQPNAAGSTFYLETTHRRGKECVNPDRMVRTAVFDEIVAGVLTALKLPQAWQGRAVEYLERQSDAAERRRQRAEAKAKLRRLVRC